MCDNEPNEKLKVEGEAERMCEKSEQCSSCMDHFIYDPEAQIEFYHPQTCGSCKLPLCDKCRYIHQVCSGCNTNNVLGEKCVCYQGTGASYLKAICKKCYSVYQATHPPLDLRHNPYISEKELATWHEENMKIWTIINMHKNK